MTNNKTSIVCQNNPQFPQTHPYTNLFPFLPSLHPLSFPFPKFQIQIQYINPFHNPNCYKYSYYPLNIIKYELPGQLFPAHPPPPEPCPRPQKGKNLRRQHHQRPPRPLQTQPILPAKHRQIKVRKTRNPNQIQILRPQRTHPNQRQRRGVRVRGGNPQRDHERQCD